MIETDFQILIAYFIGSVVGYLLSVKITTRSVLDKLCDTGFLRNYENDEGDVVIVKWNDSTKEHK